MYCFLLVLTFYISLPSFLPPLPPSFPSPLPPSLLSTQVADGPGVMVTEAGVLMVASVRLSDAGLYSCNGTNSIGMAESDTDILLKVYCELSLVEL